MFQGEVTCELSGDGSDLSLFSRDGDAGGRFARAIAEVVDN